MNLAGKSCKIWPRPPARRYVLQEKLHAAGTGCGARGGRMDGRMAVAVGWEVGTGGGARPGWGGGLREAAGGRRGQWGSSGSGMAGLVRSGDSGLHGSGERAGSGRTGRTPWAVGAVRGGACKGSGRNVQKMAQRDYRAPRKSAILSAARGPCPRVRAGPPPPRGGPARSSATGRERAGAPAAAGRPHPAEACHAGATAQTMVPPPAAPRAQ